jgi:hypothetical protein
LPASKASGLIMVNVLVTAMGFGFNWFISAAKLALFGS